MKSPRLLYNIQWTVCHIRRSVSHPRNSFKNTLKDCFKDFFKDSFKDSLHTRMLRSPMLLCHIQRQVCSFTMSNNEGLKWRKTLTQAISGSHLSLDVHFLKKIWKCSFYGSSTTLQTRLFLTQDMHFLKKIENAVSRVLSHCPNSSSAHERCAFSKKN